MIKKLESDAIEAVLKEQIIGRIGCHADGVTYIVPVSYAYDGEFVYVRTEPGMKTDIMRKNPNICFEVEAMQDMANWQSVIGWGVFEELLESAEREKALHVLLARVLPLVSSETTHLSAQWPFSPSNVNDIAGIVFKFRLTKKSGREERASTWRPLA